MVGNGHSERSNANLSGVLLCRLEGEFTNVSVPLAGRGERAQLRQGSCSMTIFTCFGRSEPKPATALSLLDSFEDLESEMSFAFSSKFVFKPDTQHATDATDMTACADCKRRHVWHLLHLEPWWTCAALAGDPGPAEVQRAG